MFEVHHLLKLRKLKVNNFLEIVGEFYWTNIELLNKIHQALLIMHRIDNQIKRWCIQVKIQSTVQSRLFKLMWTKPDLDNQKTQLKRMYVLTNTKNYTDTPCNSYC